ncbi:MAG TPA: hypothetical protein VGG33_20450 [Polyangia bacterium]
MAADEGPPVRLSLAAAGLPFTSAELESAVETRMALRRGPGPATEVTVTQTPNRGNVVVMSAQRLEEVSVAGKPSTEAARLVALAVWAVTRPAPQAHVVATAASAEAAPPPSLAARADEPGSPERRWSVGASTGFSFGVPAGDAVWESTLEGGLALGPSRRWQLAGALGYARVAGESPRGAGAFDTIPLRLTLGHRRGPLAVSAGPVIRWYGVGGDVVASPGATAGVSVDMPVGRDLTMRASLVCDAYLDRLIFRFAGAEVMQTGRFVPWLGIGFHWGAS